MAAYLLVLLNFIIFLILTYMQWSKPQVAGDDAMAYGIGIALTGIGLGIGFLAMGIYISSKDLLPWISTQKSIRSSLIISGFIMAAISSFALAIFKWEWHNGTFNPILKFLAGARADLWLPLLIIVISAWIMVGQKTVSTPVKGTTILLFTLSAIICLLLFLGWMNGKSMQQQAELEKISQQDEKIDRENLELIQQHTNTDPIVNILSLTGRYQSTAIREAAIAKIKSHSDWEDQLIELLRRKKHFSAAYDYIDAVKLERPEKFKTDIQQSLLNLADEIKTQIKENNNLQSWTFDYLVIDRILNGIVFQYPNEVKDFVPMVQQVKAALDTPLPDYSKGVKFDDSKKVNDWLKKYS